MTIHENIKHNSKIINQNLKRNLTGDPKILYQAANHLIENGGKRLRPYLVVKSCEILGGRISDAIQSACSVEMIHNFTLVHDDIMDNDEIRHGVPTVHKKFGLSVAILAGDVLFSKAFQIISQSKLSPEAIIQSTSKLANACVEVCEGQLLDIKFAEKNKIPSLKEYTKMIEKKTAALFDLSCALGAISASSNPKDVSNFSHFGKNLGIIFQVTDDLIGVIGDPKITKKPVGNDLREGKKSLPIIIAIKSATGKEREAILKVFGNPKSSKDELLKGVEVIKSLGIEKEIISKTTKYSDSAKKSLSKYSGQAKRELLDLLDFIVKRSL